MNQAKNLITTEAQQLGKFCLIRFELRWCHIWITKFIVLGNWGKALVYFNVSFLLISIEWQVYKITQNSYWSYWSWFLELIANQLGIFTWQCNTCLFTFRLWKELSFIQTTATRSLTSEWLGTCVRLTFRLTQHFEALVDHRVSLCVRRGWHT
jgi:hypothetical protein